MFVLVGPLNEHMMESTSRAAYRGILSRVESWLGDHGVPHYVPPALPEDLYADMSHLLPGGYALLAQDLWERISGWDPPVRGGTPMPSTPTSRRWRDLPWTPDGQE